MSISHRTNRLKLNGTPSVEKLQNGRYKLTVECTTMNSREDWYSANKARLFPDFGSLQSAEMSIDGLAPRTGEAYTDMRLTDVKAGNRSTLNGKAEYNVILTYETLGATFVKVKDDDISESENGLRKVKRIIIAEAGTDYVDESTPPVLKQVGITTITSQIDTEIAITCTLASYEIFDTDSYREVNELYIQAGTLSETEDKVGSQLSIVKETFASTPSTPASYSIANEQESDVDGIPTRRFTFLRNDVLLSISEDKVGSQLAIIEEYFNPAPSRLVKEDYVLANAQQSDVEGIPTARYTFLKDDVVLSETEDEVGSENSITEEWFKPSATRKVKSNYSLARKEESNVEGIPTERYTFLKDDVVLTETEDKVGSQLAIVKEVFNGTPSTPSGYSIASEQESNVDGIPTQRFTFLKDDVQLSDSEDNVGSQNAITEQWFNPSLVDAPSADPVTVDRRLKSGYSLAQENISDVEGIPTRSFTFLKDNTVLSETEDKVGSQLAIVQEVFNGTPATPDGYSIANEQESEVNGIPTRRFTFLKSNVTLSTIENYVDGREQQVIEQFDGTPTTPAGEFSIANEQISDVDGIPTRRYTYLKDDVLMTETQNLVGSQLAIVREVFNGIPDTPTGYSIASKDISDSEGLPTERYTFLKDDVQLSETEDKVGSQNGITEEWFKPAASRKTKTNYELARTDASDVDGIPTERYTFLKPSIISLRQDFNNGLKKVSIQAFGMTAAEVTSELAEVTADHLLVSQTESDYEGIKTSTFEYQIDESFVTDFELNGLKQLTLIELSLTAFISQTVGSVSTVAGATSGLRLGSQETDNGGTIKVRESLWYEDGVLSQQRRSESDGVYRSTTTFLGEIPSAGNPGAVVGPIISKTEDNVGGLKTITVSTLQNGAGGSLVSETTGDQPVASHSILSEFSYPGVVTISQLTLTGTGTTYTFKAKDFALQPPAVSKVPATLKVSFLASSAPVYTSTTGELWNPTTWAQGSSRGIGWNYLPFSISRGFRGYRIIGTAAENTYTNVGTTVSFDMISGRRIYGGTTWKIQLSGGPPNPVGSEYTLDYEVSLAFEDIDGTPYYKHREIISDIPAQTGQ